MKKFIKISPDRSQEKSYKELSADQKDSRVQSEKNLPKVKEY